MKALMFSYYTNPFITITHCVNFYSWLSEVEPIALKACVSHAPWLTHMVQDVETVAESLA